MYFVIDMTKYYNPVFIHAHLLIFSFLPIQITMEEGLQKLIQTKGNTKIQQEKTE